VALRWLEHVKRLLVCENHENGNGAAQERARARASGDPQHPSGILWCKRERNIDTLAVGEEEEEGEKQAKNKPKREEATHSWAQPA
jgi:hypothetical protein